MKKEIFKLLAKLNKAILPSFTKKRLDLAKASKIQLAIVGWRSYVTSKFIRLKLYDYENRILKNIHKFTNNY